MIGRFLCAIGIHNFIPERWLTCNSQDTGMVCRRCYKEKSA